MIKALFLIKLGIDKNKLKLIKKDIPIKVKGKKYSEHIALAYFHKEKSAPIILDYTKEIERIYKYKNQFEYKIIKKANNTKWNKFFKKNISPDDVNNLFSSIKAKNSK